MKTYALLEYGFGCSTYITHMRNIFKPSMGIDINWAYRLLQDEQMRHAPCGVGCAYRFEVVEL